MITLFLISGRRLALPTATSIRVDGDDAFAVVCVDGGQREVGRFKYSEIIGYLVGEDEATPTRLENEE